RAAGGGGHPNEKGLPGFGQLLCVRQVRRLLDGPRRGVSPLGHRGRSSWVGLPWLVLAGRGRGDSERALTFVNTTCRVKRQLSHATVRAADVAWCNGAPAPRWVLTSTTINCAVGGTVPDARSNACDRRVFVHERDAGTYK